MLFTIGVYNDCSFAVYIKKNNVRSVVSSSLVAVLLMFCSFPCINFLNFIHLFREFCKCLVVIFKEHIFTYGPVIGFLLLLLLVVLCLLVVLRIQVKCVPLFHYRFRMGSLGCQLF